MKARDLINSIREGQLRSSPDILDSLSGAIDRLEKAFPRFGSFVMEFLQNADDARSERVLFVVENDALQIANDGSPFNEANVRSICKVGRSTKTPKDYIGYLGVGFKASFLVSDSVEISSGEFQFAFQKDVWPDPRSVPWQVLPNWVDRPKGLVPQGYSTSFYLPLARSDSAEKILRELQPAELNNRILLFLRNVKRIEITTSAGRNRKIWRQETAQPTAGANMPSRWELRETDGSRIPESSHWLVFRRICAVPYEVRTDPVSILWERADVESREVVAAFRSSESGDLTREARGTAHMGVYSFLPMKEVDSGLSFLVQGDFLTNPGRSELSRQAAWNEWLAKEIFHLVRDTCIPAFRADPKWRLSLTDVLYSEHGGHELFENHIKGPLRAYLRDETVLIADDGEWASRDQLVSMPSAIKALLSTDDIGTLFPDKKLVHPDCKVPLGLTVSTKVSQIRDILDHNRAERILARHAGAGDFEWFGKLYEQIAQDYSIANFQTKYPRYNVEHDGFWDQMQDYSSKLIPTVSGVLVRISEARLPPAEGKVPEVLEGHFSIVHAAVAKDPRFALLGKRVREERFYYKPRPTLALSPISAEEIKEALSKREATMLTQDEWEAKTPEDRLRGLRMLKEAFDAGLQLDKHLFLTLPTTDDQWAPASGLILPDRYEPETHRLESLRRRGLFDVSVGFVSDSFVKDAGPDEVHAWRRFFVALGADKVAESRRAGWTARVGILTALQFEATEGRRAQELGESERPGYDIESQDGETLRYIEVKASSQEDPDISLTANEHAALIGAKKGEAYHVYVVRNAYRDPVLSVVPGRRLRKLDTRVSISFGQWSGAKLGDEFRPSAVAPDVMLVKPQT